MWGQRTFTGDAFLASFRYEFFHTNFEEDEQVKK
jgi:hypothetical protein